MFLSNPLLSKVIHQYTWLLSFQAWDLHENNRQVELVDSRLSEFNEEEVNRLIGVALLCTQTAPTLRPSMSRVIAMLSGDIEVNSVTSKPGYLTDWKFDDTSTFMSDDATRASDTSHYNSSTRTSLVNNQKDLSPSATDPILRDTIGQGR